MMIVLSVKTLCQKTREIPTPIEILDKDV